MILALLDFVLNNYSCSSCCTFHGSREHSEQHVTSKRQCKMNQCRGGGGHEKIVCRFEFTPLFLFHPIFAPFR